MEFEKVDKCPLCGRGDSFWSSFGTIELLEKEKLVSGVETVSYVVCKCGLIFHSETMTDDTRRKFYQDEYRTTRPEATDETVSRSNIIEESFRANKIIKYLNNKIEKAERCLDIGCSTGQLIKLLKDKYDCVAVGVEPNNVFREHATSMGLNVVENIQSAHGKFDLIFLIHVLEHLPKPLDMLKKISELLNDGGHLIVEVPIPSLSGGAVHYGFHLGHPIAFVSVTLFKMLKKAGFRPVDEMKGRHLLVMAQ